MLTNTEIKRINSLAQKKYRRKYNQFLIEGLRLVEAALDAGADFDALYINNDFTASNEHNDFFRKLEKSDCNWEVVEEKQLRKLSDTITPAGILALCPLSPDPRPLTPESCPSGPWLYLDSIADPGNLGTLLRTSAWFGVTNIGLSKDCVDPWSPKVLRSGMGAHFSLDIYPALGLTALHDCHLQILGADMGGTPVNKFVPDRMKQWALVLGSEAHGISTAKRKFINSYITIPKTGAGDSLNAAVAGGILLHYLKI